MTTPIGYVIHPALKPRLRWTMSSKSEVVIAIRRGEITAAQAKAAHRLTDEELAGWTARFERHGFQGLAQLTIQETRI